MSSEGHSPTFVLEHLATFTVNPENDLVYPADGMRRLLAMEKTNGIWTQKMLMKIERNMINIMDNENKEIVERFPLRLVREPTAFTSSDPKEMYNNILIYSVGHSQSENSPHPPPPAEMHIFQCVNVRARDVVETLKSRMLGKRNHNQPSPQDQFGRVKMDMMAPPYEEVESEHILGPRMIQAQLDEVEETSSTSSDHYEQDVTVLNRCFDDIEKFIARLQHSAAAFRELEKRRRSRKTKKKDLGDGMLSVRAKPPPEKEFIDIFQKFKLSFNLLAKLKVHIHDPNAPELVHFLFTPLALIVDASHDSHYGPNLPSKVVSPLLTSESIDLLINCLTSKESELWNSLGDAWYIPDNEWKGYVPPFRPVFTDGFRVPTLTEEEDNQLESIGIDEVDGSMRKQFQSDSDMEAPLPPPPAGLLRTVGRPGIFTERILPEEYRENDNPSDEEEEELSMFDDWTNDLIRRGARIARVSYPRTASNDKELSVLRGEFLEILDDSRKWWKARNSRGHIGHVPHTIVSLYEGDQRVVSRPPVGPPRQNKQTALPQTSEWLQKEERGSRRGEYRYF